MIMEVCRVSDPEQEIKGRKDRGHVKEELNEADSENNTFRAISQRILPSNENSVIIYSPTSKTIFSFIFGT